MTHSAKDLAAEDLAANGAAVVRGFLSPEDAANLRRIVNEIYDFLGSCEHISNRLLDFHFHLWHGVWLRPLPAFLRKARPDLQQRYEQSLSAVEAQVGRTFGPGWRFFPKRSYFRRHFGMALKVPWHIDADAASIYRVAGSAINVWMPLDTVGTDLPSLDFVPRSHAVMRKVPLMTGKDKYRDDAFVETIGAPETPQLTAGDALIFDQFVLHRTQNAGSADAVRTACEFRFVRHAAPTLHGLSGWLRYSLNVMFSPDGFLATRAKGLLGLKQKDSSV
jgi:Phytanoyl-CoA dioxygenase (PhyH)